MDAEAKNDKEITGRADYICEVRGAARFVVEAKGENQEIDEESDWQSYSYANHPEVRALYYVVCNGIKLPGPRINQY